MLTIINAQTNNSGSYTVIVTNRAGSVTSSNAVLTVTNIPPTILLQPTNQTWSVGSTVTLVVIATGTAPLSYQWQVDGTNSGGWRPDQWRDQQHADHQQRADQRQRHLLGHRHEPRRDGDQFQCRPDSDWFTAELWEDHCRGWRRFHIERHRRRQQRHLLRADLVQSSDAADQLDVHCDRTNLTASAVLFSPTSAQTNAPQQFYLLQLP